MKASVVVFPGSNCDRDVAVALRNISGTMPDMVWHGDSSLPNSDLIVLPGGFSYGDYLRSGAMAVHSPIMKEVMRLADRGTPILGICNGFQVLTETGLLPGVLMRNATLKFICRNLSLRVERNDTIFSRHYTEKEVITIPIANHDGNYFADQETLNRLENENRVAFRYTNAHGEADAASNPTGSRNNIAGIYDQSCRILGLMPHPERVSEELLGGLDGKPLFESLLEVLH
ncbi:MAG: phosphoribosylformylglycinamidine synthase subunit PurQ [Methyloligellaceae bacterium]